MTSLDAVRLRAAALADQLADRLAVPPPLEPCTDSGPSSPCWQHQSLAGGAAGIAILHGARAQTSRGEWQAVHAWLTRATSEDLSAGPGAGLWFGAPAVAFAMEIAAEPGQYERVHATLDAAVQRLVRTRLDQAHARMRMGAFVPRAEYDLVHGLSGLGAYLLRSDPHGGVIRAVLAYLVRLTLPLRGEPTGMSLPGWWTGDVPSRPPHADAGGHADLGMAHGISGPLALLALAMREGITVDGHHAAIDRICRWMDTWRGEGPAGPWWPERVSLADLYAGRSSQSGPARPSWCYGTPGIARAQQLAARVTGDHARQQLAEHALDRCLSDPVQLARFIDPALCHGWAGMIATVWAAAVDARSPEIAAHLPNLLSPLLGIAADDSPVPHGLIDGTAGVALTLHEIVTGTRGRWQTCLLIN
ncbi:lanthionine synthetase C family protein [Actinoallomurus purpureus]|uniref:lanthionine synthetase C family protein n=1 Tax=Actinoallomurus purpureus TaxID=478114 RepID=UPI002093C21E|nr:lanthionine synthetase C family protein [Actinoallomurus purpureus]MCO6004750.1 lanthionine synthetase C family protein [Actinoallomurus purpureus]